MTAFYGDFNRAEHEEKSLQTIAKALELGLNFFDTAWIYQSFGATYLFALNLAKVPIFTNVYRFQ